MMRWIKIILIYSLVLVAVNALAQKDRKYIRQGNKEFENGDYENSEISYRKAADLEKKKSQEPSFNVGDALYKQKKYEDAVNQFNTIADLNVSKEDKAKIYHNLGNSLLQNKKLKESIEAYKNALRNNPNDMETKYNLAYAQKKLEQQQQQQKKDKNKDKNKDKDKDKKDKNKDQQNKDQNKDKKDQKKDQQNKDQQNKDKQDQNKNQQQQQKQQISKQDAQRILQALANDEKKTQKKVKEQQAAAAKVKVEKEW